MDDFDYSTEAKNVKNQFYGVEKLVYVEGDDDVPFWEFVFEKLADFTVEVGSVGGKAGLKKHIEPIVSNTAEYLVAMDSDFDHFIEAEKHPNIISTYGHSIENTLINNKTIYRIIKNVAKLSIKEVPKKSYELWLKNLNETIKPLVLLDLINDTEGLGFKIFPEHFNNNNTFMKSKNSCEFCKDKINNHIEQLSIKVSKKKLKEKEKLLDEKGLNYYDIFRGHFFISAVIKFIKVQVKKFKKNASISLEMLYSNLMTAFEIIFDEKHPHYEHYRKQILLINLSS